MTNRPPRPEEVPLCRNWLLQLIAGSQEGNLLQRLQDMARMYPTSEGAVTERLDRMLVGLANSAARSFDFDQLRRDLDYAIDQLQKARAAVEHCESGEYGGFHSPCTCDDKGEGQYHIKGCPLYVVREQRSTAVYRGELPDTDAPEIQTREG